MKKKKALGKNIVKGIPYKKAIIISFSINLAIAAAVLFLQKYLPPVVPLFYGKPKGEDQLASSILLVIPPSVSATIVIINLILIKVIKNNFLQKVLVGVMVAVTILSTITVIKIISVVGSISWIP